MVEWKNESVNHKNYGNFTLLRTETQQGEWTISQINNGSKHELAKVSYGKFQNNYMNLGIRMAIPNEIGCFGSVWEAKIAVEIWTNPGVIQPNEQARRNAGFEPYIEGLEEREFSRTTSLLMSTKDDYQSLTISAKNCEYIGLIYFKYPANGRLRDFPGEYSLEENKTIGTNILLNLLELRLLHPYDKGKGIRTPLNESEFQNWLENRNSNEESLEKSNFKF